MKIKIIVGALILSVITSVTAIAEKNWNNGEYPVVPLEVAAKGMQAVTTYLLRQVDGIQIRYSGGSVMNENVRVGIVLTGHPGYTHRGSFEQMSELLEGTQSWLELLPLPNGGYDVRQELTYHTEQGSVAFRGYGHVPVWKDDGEIETSSPEPHVYISEKILIKIEGQAVAKLTGGGVWEYHWTDLPVHYNWEANESFVEIPTFNLDRGYLALSIKSKASSELFAVEMGTGVVVTGAEAAIIIGESHSPYIFVSDSQLTLPQTAFYQSNGKIFGRYPAVELPVGEEGINTMIRPAVKVWGSETEILPTSIMVETIPTDGSSPREFPLYFSQKHGKWLVKLPKGRYFLRLDFPILDWNLDPSGKG